MQILPVLMSNITAGKEVKPFVLKGRDFAELLDRVDEDITYVR